MNKWGERSTAGYNKLCSDLKVLCDTVLKEHDCAIVYGYRGRELQHQMFLDGRSKFDYPRSKHNENPSIAVDLAPWVLGVELYDKDYAKFFCGYVLGIADMLYLQGKIKNKIRAGYNWSTKRDKNFKLNTFQDWLHFECER